MRILVGHNYYVHRGGEDVVFENETNLLKSKGHSVTTICRRNDTIHGHNQFATAVSAIWSARSRKELSALLRSGRFDIAHFHNTFPLLSPSVYAACRDAGIPVVQTLHNFRWICPAATLYRDHAICEKCLTSIIPYHAVVHACYQKSRLRSVAVASMVAVHDALGDVRNNVSLFVAPTKFLREKFVEQGFPDEKFVVKPPFMSADPGEKSGSGKHVLYLGRLSEEKGVGTMLSAWEQIKTVPLRIAGDGPMRHEVEEFLRNQGGGSVTYDGLVPHSHAMKLLKEACVVIVPSECYEVFPNVIVESFACGVPVIVPSHGGLLELIDEGVTGLCYRTGDAADLAAKVEWAWDNPGRVRTMGTNARNEYLKKYTAEINHGMMLQMYEKAISAQSFLRT